MLSHQSLACNDWQKTDLRHYELQAVEIIKNWLDRLESKYQVDMNSVRNRSPRNTQSQTEMAAGILMCSQKVLEKGFNYQCTNSTEYTAITMPLFGREVKISDVGFWRLHHPAKVAVVLHESTHKCGTNDAIYFKDDERPRNHGFYGWATIASTYEVWALQGLCIPGQDCD